MAKIICFKTHKVLANLPSSNPGLPRQVKKWNTDLCFSWVGCTVTVIAHTQSQAQCIMFTINQVLKPIKKSA